MATYILSFGRHAKHELKLADQLPDSSLSTSEIIRTTSGLSSKMIHTRVEENEAVRANQIDTTATRLTTEQKDEFLSVGIIEVVYKLLALADGHATIKSEVAIP